MTTINCSASKSGQNRVRVGPEDYVCNLTGNFRPQSVISQYLENSLQVFIGDDTMFFSYENNQWVLTGNSKPLNLSGITGGADNLKFTANYPNTTSTYNVSVSGTKPDMTLNVNYNGPNEIVIVPASGWGYWWIWLLIVIAIIVGIIFLLKIMF